MTAHHLFSLFNSLSLKTTVCTHSPSRFRSWAWLNEPERIQWVQAVGVDVEMEATFEPSQLGIQTSPLERWRKTQSITLLVTVSCCAPSGWTHQTMIKTTSCTAHSCWGCQEWEDIYSSRFMTELQNQVQHLQGGGRIGGKLSAFFFATEYYKLRIRTENLLHTFKCMKCKLPHAQPFSKYCMWFQICSLCLWAFSSTYKFLLGQSPEP